MLAFEDKTTIVAEPKNARLEVRTQPSVKEAINHAARLKGVDVSSFVVSAAYDVAKATITSHQLTRLESEADKKAFFDALDNPPKPSKRLIKAFALREKLIANAD